TDHPPSVAFDQQFGSDPLVPPLPDSPRSFRIHPPGPGGWPDDLKHPPPKCLGRFESQKRASASSRRAPLRTPIDDEALSPRWRGEDSGALPGDAAYANRPSPHKGEEGAYAP